MIIAIDGKPVRNGSAVQVKVNSFHPGDKAKVTVVRDGNEKDFSHADGQQHRERYRVGDSEIAFYGTTLKEASKEALEKFGLKKGVEVTSVGTGKMLEAGASEE